MASPVSSWYPPFFVDPYYYDEEAYPNPSYHNQAYFPSPRTISDTFDETSRTEGQSEVSMSPRREPAVLVKYRRTDPESVQVVHIPGCREVTYREQEDIIARHPRFFRGLEEFGHLPPPDFEAIEQDAAPVSSQECTPPPKKTMSMWAQICASVAVALGTLVGGFSSAYTAPAVASMTSNATSFRVTPEDISWIGSLQPGFALFGGLMGGFMLESLGRKWTIILGRIPFIPAFALIYYANSIWLIMAGRILAGIGVGIETLSSPVYLGEVVDSKIRGTLGLFPTILGNLGVLIAYIIGSYLDWRELAMVGIWLPLPFFLFVYFLPESPTWIKLKEARKARSKIQNGTQIPNTEYPADLEGESPGCSAWTEMFQRDNLRALFICLGLQFFQQFSGINAVIYYTVTIFQEAGSSIDSNLSSIIVGVVNMVSTILATGLVDKTGRRVLLLISCALMWLSMTTMSVFFYFQNHGGTCDGCGWIPLVSLVVFIFGFSVGAGPLPWLMMGELLPKRVRGQAAAFTTAFHWGCTFVVTKTFVDMSVYFGNHSSFFMFAVICFVGMVCIVFVPETKGKTLDEIEQNMAELNVKKVKKELKGVDNAVMESAEL